MREIKFRVWNGIKMHYNIEGFGDNMYCISIYQDEWISGWLMQYTGLNDRNNREIWEGDVLGDEYGNVRYEVFRIAGGFGVNTHKDDLGRETLFYTALGDMQMMSYVSTNCVVLGNKYENEGLIKRK